MRSTGVTQGRTTPRCTRVWGRSPRTGRTGSGRRARWTPRASAPGTGTSRRRRAVREQRCDRVTGDCQSGGRFGRAQVAGGCRRYAVHDRSWRMRAGDRKPRRPDAGSSSGAVRSVGRLLLLRGIPCFPAPCCTSAIACRRRRDRGARPPRAARAAGGRAARRAHRRYGPSAARPERQARRSVPRDRAPGAHAHRTRRSRCPIDARSPRGCRRDVRDHRRSPTARSAARSTPPTWMSCSRSS